MKSTDLIAVAYLMVIVALLVLFQPEFIAATQQHPYLMGFVKVACLATFGECLKKRIMTGTWQFSRPVARFFVWGLFGVWFAAAFPFAISGTRALIDKHLWIDGPKLWVAFSSSLWINPLGGYAFTMMVTHEYCNKAIDRGAVISLKTFSECMTGSSAANAWFRFIPKTIFFFWIPAHTITFLLPQHYYVLFAASLSIVLGFILTLAQRAK
ncbi:MAG: hypothetical protein V1685_02895 [Parcubacteria group bacterium]